MMRLVQSCLSKQRNAYQMVWFIFVFTVLWLLFLSLGGGWWSPGFTRDKGRDARFKAAITSDVRPPLCKGCMLQATNYVPSPLESKWASKVRGEFSKRGVCKVISEEVDVWQQWLDDVSLTRGPELGGTQIKKNLPSAVEWSHISYKTEDGSEVKVRLEPLAGFLRDPRNACEGISLVPSLEPYSQDSKAHIFLDPVFYGRVAESLRGTPKAFLFDLGSTRWVSTKSSSSGQYSGLSWLVNAYKGLGIEFDGLYTWEARSVPALEYFADMPSSLVARTHFFNAPVMPGVNGNGPQAVLSILKSVALPGDFVVFKLDIDSDYLEEEITLDLLEVDELSALVDDFYFEHHVDTHGIMERVGWSKGLDLPRDIADSIALFQALRKRGIRSHSWP